VPLLLIVTLPWFIAIGIASHGEFFKSSLGGDFAAKIQSGQEAHGAPPGFYLATFWLTFWPATLFITFDGLKRLWRMRGSRRALFVLAWILPWWVIIEAIPTKLPHYALPLYPALALAAVMALRTMGGYQVPPARLAAIVWCVVAAALALFLLVLSWIAEARQFVLLTAVLAAFAGASAFTGAASWRGLHHAALCGILASAALIYTAAFSIALPGLQPIWISETAAAAARSLRSCYSGPAGFTGFSAPSLVFLNGTKTLLTSPPGLSDALASNRAGLAFVNWKQREEFERAYEQKTGAPPRSLGCADGVDINGKGPTRLQIYVNSSVPAGASCAPPPSLQCEPKQNLRWRRLLNSPF
jgi:4-amino-4-deoxy-L-arabinose transferase-like glycosyltransferase